MFDIKKEKLLMKCLKILHFFCRVPNLKPKLPISRRKQTFFNNIKLEQGAAFIVPFNKIN
jgi:hypothetical protein